MSSTETASPSMQNCCGGTEVPFDCAAFMQTMHSMRASASDGENAADCCAKMQKMCSGATEAASGQQK